MIREYLKRKKNLKVFSKLVSPETVEESLSGKSIQKGLRQGLLEFIIVAIDEGSAEVTAKRVETVCECATKQGALIDCIVSSLVVIVYGNVPLNNDLSINNRKRRELVETLEQTMKNQVKIIHGNGSGHFGLLGSNGRFSYSFILPKFLETVAALSNLKFGEIKEINL